MIMIERSGGSEMFTPKRSLNFNQVLSPFRLLTLSINWRSSFFYTLTWNFSVTTAKTGEISIGLTPKIKTEYQPAFDHYYLLYINMF